MIVELESASHVDQSWDRINALRLFRVRNHGVHVIDTILVSNALFKLFLENGSVPDEHLYRIIKISSQWKGASPSEVYVRCSLPTEYPGLQDGFRSCREITDLKFWIEKVYRSWSDDKARCFRITKSIRNEDSFPAIIIQPFVENMATLCTRAPKTGHFTDRDNWDMNIHNTVTKFEPSFTEWLQLIETAVKKPCKVHFGASEDKPICSITEQVMTEEASLGLLHEYLQCRLIDDLEYLSRIEPGKLALFEGYDWSNTAAASGLPASPGIVYGKVVFRTSNWRSRGEDSLVSVADEYIPEDIDLMMRCQAAVCARGGKTSHAAVVCRGLGKPAVVGAEGLEVDDVTRTVGCGDSLYSEASGLVVDGNTGALRFTENPLHFPRYVLNPSVKRYVKKMIRVLNSIDEKSFGSLPLPLQYHLSDLKRVLRSVGRLK